MLKVKVEYCGFFLDQLALELENLNAFALLEQHSLAKDDYRAVGHKLLLERTVDNWLVDVVRVGRLKIRDLAPYVASVQ